MPSIAKLVERRTVVDMIVSLDRWFDSGPNESFNFFLLMNDFVRIIKNSIHFNHIFNNNYLCQRQS